MGRAGLGGLYGHTVGQGGWHIQIEHNSEAGCERWATLGRNRQLACVQAETPVLSFLERFEC